MILHIFIYKKVLIKWCRGEEMEKIILEIDRDWIEPFCDSFGEVKSDILVNLLKEDKKYQDFFREKEKILDTYPKLRDVIENNEIVQLSEEEVKGIIKMERLWLDVKEVQDEEIFLKGIQVGYLIFKKIGLIKD